MKKYLHFIIVFISAFCLFSLVNSCTDEKELIEELNLANVLTPTSTSASISIYDGRTVTFTWSSSSTATQYVLEIYRWADGSQPSSAAEITADMLSGMSAYITAEVLQGTGSNTTHEEFLDVDYAYYARVKGQNPGNQGDSNWAAFRYPIEPYLVMDPLPTFEVIERTASSITVSWELDDDDSDGIDQVRVSPNPDDPASSYKIYTVTTGATECALDGLDPSTQYTLSANFGTATRNTIIAWTKADADGVTVSTSYDLQEAITNGLSPIIVAYTGETYEIDAEFTIGDIGIDELYIYGDGTANGTLPTIHGKFALASGTSVKTIHLESLDLVGDSGDNVCVFSVAAGDYDEISMLNCSVSSYLRGIINAGSTTVNVGTFSLESISSSDIEGNGGGFIDFRGTSGAETIGSFSIKNSTFDGGIREFIRINANYTVSDFTIDHNTFNAITSADNSYGIFYVRAEIVNDCVVTNNLFLNLAESYVHGVSGRYVVGASAFTPTRSTGNYWYNLGDYAEGNVFPTSGETGWKQAAAFSGGGVLDSDPCYDSSRSNFYVTNADVFNAGAGDPRWLADYVEQPDPALEVVEYGYEWNLTDTKTFYDVIDQTCTRGNTRFLVEETPIQVSSDGFYFTDKSTLMSYSGAPSDCGIGFIVDGPGSVVLSTAEGRQTGFEVSYGIYDESMVSISGQTTVAGSVSGGARKESVVLDALEKGTIYMVYIYSLGPAYLTQLVWSDDTTSGGSGLTAPYDLELSAESASNTEGVTLSWAAIPNAGSYNVNIVGYNGTDTTESVTTNSYTISGLEAGYYNFYVQAVPADSDSTRDPSEWSDEEVLFFSKGGELTTVSAYSDTDWGSSTFEYVYNAMANGTTDKFTLDFVYDNLNFIGGDTNSVLNDAVNEAGETVYAYSLGGSGSTSKRALTFKIPGDGFLKMEIQSNGTSVTCYMKVFLDGVEYTTGEGYATSDDGKYSGYEAPDKPGTNVHKITITGAHSGSEIMVYSASSGMNVLSLGWENGESEGGGISPTDETINEEYITDYSNEGTDAGYADVADGETLTVNKITYAGAITWDSSRYKMNGASKVGDDGIPTSRYASFKIATTGTITHKMISGSSSDGTRRYDVILVKEVDGKTVVTTLYSDYAPMSSGADAVTTEVTAADLGGATEPATVYVYVEANCNLYQIGYSPDN